MTINAEDVKVYESQRLTDEDDGGGRATGNEVIDGNINNLFPDISRLDRTVGDVALRKCFVGVATDNADTYLGAHAIIVEPPADTNVHTVLFDAGSESDQRTSAQQRIESYVVKGAAAQFHLLGNQYEGQRQVVCYQREEQPLPEVGDVFQLKSTLGEEQYVRLTEVSGDVQTFTVDDFGDGFITFDRRRLDVSISAPLDFTFEAPDPTPSGPTVTSHSEVFSTEVADAARYWGVSRSTDPAVVGDLSVKVESIYSSLVPSAQLETPLIDQFMGLQPKDIREAAGSNYTQAITAQYISTTQIRAYLIRPAVKGTVSLTLGGSTYLDDGTRTLIRDSGAEPFATLEIDHATGLVLGTRDTGSSTVGTDITGSANFRPGGLFSGNPLSLGEDVTLANRGFNWIRTFTDAKPRPGTTVVSYMSLGKWYDLTDPGNGILEGVGSGTVNFTTGTIAITTLALPDVASTIMFSFIIDLADDTEEHSGTNSTVGAEIQIDIGLGIAPGSVVVNYLSGAAAKTIDDSVTVGVLAGDGVGAVDYAGGTVRFTPTTLPDDGTSITVDHSGVGSNGEYVISSPVFNSAGVITGTIPNAPIEPGSITIDGLVSYTLIMGLERTAFHSMADDGLGGVRHNVANPGYAEASKYWHYGLPAVGTINYTTGAFSIEMLHQWLVYDRTYSVTATATKSAGYSTATTTVEEESAGPVTIYYNPAGPSNTAGQTVHSLESILLAPLTGAAVSPLVPGSLMFTLGGTTFIDRDGQIYDQFNSTTGSARSVGTINYSDKLISLNTWPAGSGLGVEVLAAQTLKETLAVDEIIFRTPGRPLRPESMSISITDQAGNVISEVAGVDGSISGASVAGNVNLETGVTSLIFTDGTNPVYIYPDTGRYSAVLFSFLPLDAELIGLNPVRLPSDGRVPVYREGDVLVLSHTTATTAGTPTDGQVITLARDHQASIVVEDSAGVIMDPDQYTGNRITGVVTFASPVVLQAADTTALTPPLSIKDRVEHMTVANDVQITGELSFISPLPHDFPATDTIVSSSIVWGDINSRVYSFFTQRTWNSGSPNWTDARVGDDTTAQYNEIDYPIEFANRGAVTEKWALVFKSTTSFDIVGQTLGIIGTGSIFEDTTPINNNTTFPYFVVRSAGWGSGWANGNVIRFNTEGCLAPLWIARTVLSGMAQEDDDQFTLQIRGDAD